MVLGIKNQVFLKPNNSSQIVDLISCEIIALNGTVLDVISLHKFLNFTDLYFGSFTPINGNFHLQVTIFVKFDRSVQTTPKTFFSRQSKFD